MSEQDYWHKIGGQRWLAERLGAERKKLEVLERIATALETLVGEKVKEEDEMHSVREEKGSAVQ